MGLSCADLKLDVMTEAVESMLGRLISAIQACVGDDESTYVLWTLPLSQLIYKAFVKSQFFHPSD